MDLAFTFAMFAIYTFSFVGVYRKNRAENLVVEAAVELGA